MKRKEFKKRLDDLISLRYKGYYKVSYYTCSEIHAIIGKIAKKDYHNLISMFLNSEGCPFFLSEYSPYDDHDSIDVILLRTNLLIAFKDEVLATKRYRHY